MAFLSYRFVILNCIKNEIHMKKLIFTLAICLLSGTTTIWAARNERKQATVEVVLHKTASVGKAPRSMVPMPFCKYDGFINSVTVDFPDCDTSFSVTVVNSLTGEQFSEQGSGMQRFLFLTTRDTIS